MFQRPWMQFNAKVNSLKTLKSHWQIEHLRGFSPCTVGRETCFNPNILMGVTSLPPFPHSAIYGTITDHAFKERSVAAGRQGWFDPLPNPSKMGFSSKTFVRFFHLICLFKWKKDPTHIYNGELMSHST